MYIPQKLHGNYRWQKKCAPREWQFNFFLIHAFLIFRIKIDDIEVLILCQQNILENNIELEMIKVEILLWKIILPYTIFSIFFGE